MRSKRSSEGDEDTEEISRSLRNPESETVHADSARNETLARQLELAILEDCHIGRDRARNPTCSGNDERLCGAIALWKRECCRAVAGTARKVPLQVDNTQGVLEESTRTEAAAEVVPPVLERRLAGSADNMESFGLRDGIHRLHQEDRHLLPGHWVGRTEVAAAATAGDSPPREFLDVRTERAASRHVVEHLPARHARGWLDIQGLGQLYRHLLASCPLGESRCRGTKANQRQKNAGQHDAQTKQNAQIKEPAFAKAKADKLRSGFRFHG
jgi:hypothetical protein